MVFGVKGKCDFEEDFGPLSPVTLRSGSGMTRGAFCLDLYNPCRVDFVGRGLFYPGWRCAYPGLDLCSPFRALEFLFFSLPATPGHVRGLNISDGICAPFDFAQGRLSGYALFRPFRAFLGWSGRSFPGRCPGLYCFRPVGALEFLFF